MTKQEKSTFTLAEGGQSPLFNGYEVTQGSPCLIKKGFTLAEVLITLVVIGVVAAVTMPTLLQRYKNQEVESKLRKIYTVMNQAIRMSEVDNGPKEYWDNACTANEEGSRNDDCKQNFEKYFLKYLKYSKVEDIPPTSGLYEIAIWMNDGSLLAGKYNKNANNVVDFTFYPNAKNFDGALRASSRGITHFLFGFMPSCTSVECKYHYKKGFEPYIWKVTEFTKEELTETGAVNYTCNKNSLYKNYCTALIYLNGWKIPKDYPFKVK